MTSSHNGQPAPLPVPPDFPLVWGNPEDERIFWTRDRLHYPDQVSPLDYSLSRIGDEGFGKAFAYYGVPMQIRSLYINTYQYGAMVPSFAVDFDPAEAGKAVEEKMQRAIGRQQDRWGNEWLPEIKEHLAWWEAFDLSAASPTELVEHLDESIRRTDRLWEIHFLVVFPMMVPMSLFEELYLDLFPDSAVFEAYEMMQGLSNMTVESGSKLWALSRKALTTPEVRAAVAEGDANHVLARLRQSAAGQQFLAEFDSYLDVYGRRGDKWSYRDVSWIEDPTPVLNNLRDYMSQPDRDLDAELTALATQRETRIAATRAALQSFPQPVVGQFEFLLAAAQLGTILSEDHGYWIDFRASYALRRVIMECGRRLVAAGVANAADDVFLLTLAELRETLLQTPHPDRHGLIAERQAVMDHFATVAAPPALGTPPPDGGPGDDPVGRTLGKFFGQPPAPSDDPNVINGNAGSPGVARGPAKVVCKLTEAGKLEPGDILVTETTAPPWTPLFATAAAVVTDTGGILSHCAVVAREYGIPAVVGTQYASEAIRDGQIVEVDGNAGIVRILSQANQ
jgi:pyruvate,water dikinase